MTPFKPTPSTPLEQTSTRTGKKKDTNIASRKIPRDDVRDLHMNVAARFGKFCHDAV